jgi:hypothetical protein
MAKSGSLTADRGERAVLELAKAKCRRLHHKMLSGDDPDAALEFNAALIELAMVDPQARAVIARIKGWGIPST